MSLLLHQETLTLNFSRVSFVILVNLLPLLLYSVFQSFRTTQYFQVFFNLEAIPRLYVT